MISPFDSIEEVNEQLTACKTAIKEIMGGKSVRLNVGGGDRLWTSEDLDKLQSHLNYLANERAKFQKKTRSVTVIGRPAR